MIEAIIALVGVIISAASGIINSNAASLAAMRATREANVKFEREKELTHYTNSTKLITNLGIFIGIALVAIGAILFISK